MNTWHESLASCSAPQENQYTAEGLFPTPAAPDSDGEHQQNPNLHHPHHEGSEEGRGRRDGGSQGYERDVYHDGGYHGNGNGYDLSRAGGARGGRGPGGWAGYTGQGAHGHRYAEPY